MTVGMTEKARPLLRRRGEISARKRAANRRNALLSTGPQTLAGKARAARNARRHGLTLSARLDPARARDIEALARAIAGSKAGAECRERADRIAAAQIELIRVRQARRDLMAGGRFTRAFIRRLASLDRYERRAFSGRKSAIRRFDRAQQWYGGTTHFGQNEATAAESPTISSRERERPGVADDDRPRRRQR